MALLTAVAAVAGEIDIAREALRDGLWEIARTHAAAAPDGPETRLIVLESLAGEGRWDAVGQRLTEWKDARGEGFDYYRAVVAGDMKAAAEILRRGGSAEGCVEARLRVAQELARTGNRAEAAAVWREVASQTNVSERALAIASSNLMDADLLARAYGMIRSVSLRRRVGLRLGRARLNAPETADEGERLIRSLVKDSPDEEGSCEAFLAIADEKNAACRWKEAVDAYREAIEIWPAAAKLSNVQENRGWALLKLGRREEALEAFRTAGALAEDDSTRAMALLKEGDVLSDLGRADEAMARYREAMEKYPKTTVAEKLSTVIQLREIESEGRRLYAEFRYAEAMRLFARVAEEDSSRRQRMAYFEMLCLYGQGFDDRAEQKARAIVDGSPDPVVRFDAMLWLAKFLFNRREWKESERLFVAHAESAQGGGQAAESLLWASRASLAANDFATAISLSTRLLDRYPDAVCKAEALLVQGEALVELARFDEAVLVFERVAVSDGTNPDNRRRAQLLKADSLYVMGADNPVRYEAALGAYRSLLQGDDLTPSRRLVVAFKIARSLEKLKRTAEAEDQLYAHVVLAYRNGRIRGDRFDDEARAAFSRAAFSLVDGYETRGRIRQALNVLNLVVASDVPAAEEASRRVDRILNKGGFL